MDRETLESLKDDIIGDPLEGYLFGKPVVICAFRSDFIMTMPGFRSMVKPHDVLKDWWDGVVSAAEKDRHDPS